MKKKLALGGAVVLVLAAASVLALHAVRPDWFVRSLMKESCHRAASHGAVIVVAIPDRSVEQRESPSNPMVLQRIDPGRAPVDLTHVYDVSSIAVTSSHVFYTLYNGLTRRTTSIQAMPLAGGSAREVGTSDEYVSIAGAGDRVFWVTNKGAMFSATASGPPGGDPLHVDAIRCVAPYSDQEVVAATSTQVFTTSDIGVHAPIGDAFDGCSLTTYMGAIHLATWSPAGGTIRRLVPNETRWETVLSGRGKSILMRGTPNGLVWAEEHMTIFWLGQGKPKPKKILAYDGVAWLDADADGHILLQAVDEPIVRVVW